MKGLRTVVRVGGSRANLCATLALTFAAIVVLTTLAGCNDYGNTFQSPTGAAINFISPSDATAGGAQFTLTVTSNSGGFVSQSVVQWDGKTIPTTYVSATELTATVAASLIAKAGTNYVNTLSPHSGAGTNGLSNTLTFIVNPTPNPVPSISSISPNTAAAGSASFTLTVNGGSFLPTSDPSGGSQVHWNLGGTQSTLPIVSASSSQITATVDSSLLVNTSSQAVAAIVTVYNPPSQSSGAGTGSGGGVSPNGLPFTITPAGSHMAKPIAAAVAEETPAVSVDGRYVAYSAVQGGHTQVFLHDSCEGAAAGCQSRTVLLSVAADGTPGNDDSKSPSMSADGRYVAFSSAATNLVSGAPAGRQIYLRDTCGGVATSPCTPSTQLVSSDPQGALVGTESILPSVSASGRFVAFLAITPSHNAATRTSSSPSAQPKASVSDASNSGYRQVFVHDTCLGVANGCTPKFTCISLLPGDASASDAKPAGPALSGSSSHVALSGANAATVFTRSVAVDDRVFLALTGKQQ
jgi:WD40-like Beta Propeller Repeat